MKIIESVIKTLLIPIFLIDYYLIIILLAILAMDWIIGPIFIPFYLPLYLPLLLMVILYQQYFKRRCKTLWQRHLAAVGISVFFYFTWATVYIYHNYYARNDVLSRDETLLFGILSLPIGLGGVVMAWVEGIFFKDPIPKKGLSRFMKFFIIALGMIPFCGLFSDILFDSYRVYIGRSEWKYIWKEYDFSRYYHGVLVHIYYLLWFLLLLVLGHYHLIFKRIKNQFFYYIVSMLYMGIPVLLFQVSFFELTPPIYQAVDRRFYLIIGLSAPFLGLPLAFLQRLFFRKELKK